MYTDDQEAALRLARRVAEGNTTGCDDDMVAIMKVYLRQSGATASDSNQEFRRKFGKLFNKRD